MKSVNEKLKRFRDEMNTLSTDNVSHYKRPGKNKPQYVVWQEDGSGTDGWFNNHMGEQQIHGTIDLFTLQEYDILVDEIQERLNNLSAGWSLQSVQYEDETNLIHYEWEWSI